MARIRTIKPSFFRSRTIASLTYAQRLTFAGLWTHVDDEGRCEYDPELIKADVWPRERTLEDVIEDLHALTECSLITHYVIGERSYLQVSGFAEHQRVNRPTPSKVPPPSEGLICPLTSGDESSVRTHAQLTEDSPPEGKGREGKKDSFAPLPVADATTEPGALLTLVPPTSKKPEDDFPAFWDAYPRKDGRKPCLTAYLKARKSVTAEFLLDAAQRYAMQVRRERRAKQHILLGSSWLNGERWTDESTAAVRPPDPSMVRGPRFEGA